MARARAGLSKPAAVSRMSTAKATALLLERLGSASTLVLSQHDALPAEPVTGVGASPDRGRGV